MNVLLISVDSLRYDSVAAEDRPFSTPTIDALWERGTVCSQAFTCAPYTADSFTSILGGTYPWEYGTTTEGFERNRPHVVEAFTDAGYQTCGLYGNPYLGPAFGYDRGWDHYEEGESDTDSNLLARFRRFVVEHMDRDTAAFSAIRSAHRTIGNRLGIELEGKPYPSAEILTDAFLDWLSTTDDEPVFGWIHYMDVHSPFYPHKGTISEDISKREALQTFYGANMRPRKVTDPERDLLRRLYRGEIQYLDRELSRLFEGVDDYLGHDEIAVAFVSDHGEAFGEHAFCFHPKELYDELVHVPLVFDLPNYDCDRLETPVSNVDVIPTLLEAAELTKSEPWTGKPVQQLDPKNTRSVFAHAIDESTMQAMITDGKWKLIRSIQTGQEELYDRTTDTAEQDDRINAELDLAADYSARLDDHLDTMELDNNMDDSDRKVPDEINEQLRNLGYKQ